MVNNIYYSDICKR